MRLLEFAYKHECEDCGHVWYSDESEENCIECSSSNCFHFDNVEDE